MEEKLSYRPLVLADKGLVQKYIDFWDIKTAGLQFSTLFMWGSGERIRIAEAEDALFISVTQDGRCMSVAPLTTKPENYAHILKLAEEHCHARGQAARLCVIPEQTAPYIREAGFELSEDRGNYEYVYSARDLIELPGKAYHGKRNHINAFLMNASYEYVKIGSNMHEDCMRVLDEWSADKEGEPGLEAERKAISLALSNMEALGLVGGGIVTGGKLAAFSIGEAVGGDTAVIHFEKALDERGLFPLINRDFIANAFSDMLYVNREEDMGDEGLRKAKMSYKPLRMEKVYTACRKI